MKQQKTRTIRITKLAEGASGRGGASGGMLNGHGADGNTNREKSIIVDEIIFLKCSKLCMIESKLLRILFSGVSEINGKTHLNFFSISVHIYVSGFLVVIS
uniref:Uncharacterized protein n=1 Tax=Aegilops tauschii subsp. strangulata TaxID=200361 RepID=A0A453D5R6_AEGTS